MELLEWLGRVPLPHYIRGGLMVPADVTDYQTVFAQHPGSVAAPTAGLHFTHVLLDQLQRMGVHVFRITLHVGLGTFRPMATDTVEQHVMHSEWCTVPADVAAGIQQTRQAGGKIIAVGSTVVRSLETAAQSGQLQPWTGETRLFIRPPFSFAVTDALMTNFHLPRSSLMVLVRTFGGDALIRRAYASAVAEQYRFFSYGDAMLIL
jgi:S-adenosylmethionine:tRNA ribosyltransferase-isomerase